MFTFLSKMLTLRAKLRTASALRILLIDFNMFSYNAEQINTQINNPTRKC